MGVGHHQWIIYVKDQTSSTPFSSGILNISINVYSWPRYESKEIALNCGMILRECLKFEQLAQLFIETGDFYLMFQYIELPTFDIASDAFATFEVHRLFELYLTFC